MFKDIEDAWGTALSMARYSTLVAGNPARFSSKWKRELAIIFPLQTETSAECSEHYGEILYRFINNIDLYIHL